MADDDAFIEYEAAWSFHRNSSRWVHNAMESSGQDDVPESGRENPLAPFVKLPPPLRIEADFSQLLEARHSSRDFTGAPLSLSTLGTILHYALGVWGRDAWNAAEFLERPAPSGGGMYPLEIYVLARALDGAVAGVHHYQPLLHGLEEVRDTAPPRPLLRYLFMGQYPAAEASAILAIGADAPRSMKKYGDRGYRYMLLEAGHVAQNVNLACVALGLQSLNLGGFFDDELARLCRMDAAREIPLYAIAIGESPTANKHANRFAD